jgi:hypothetical protein
MAWSMVIILRNDHGLRHLASVLEALTERFEHRIPSARRSSPPCRARHELAQDRGAMSVLLAAGLPLPTARLDAGSWTGLPADRDAARAWHNEPQTSRCRGWCRALAVRERQVQRTALHLGRS